MIDAAELRARAQKAREFEVEVDPGKRFTLRLPTQYELVLAERRVRASHADDPVAPLVLQRALTEGGIVGWSGLTVADILPGAEDAAEVLDYQAAIVGMVLDENTHLSLKLGSELFDRLVKRNGAAAEDAKN
jgi:hypothetical protein